MRRRYVTLVGAAVGAEVGGDGLAGGGLVFDDGEGVVAEPLEELEPAVGVVEGEGVGEGGLDGAGVGPAEEPVLAVGEDAHTDAPAPVGLLEVVVELVDVVGVGFEAAVGADSALELDEGVEGGEVDGAAGTESRGVFFDHVVGSDKAGGNEEVADGGGDVRLRFVVFVASKNLGGGVPDVGVVVVYVWRHCWVLSD